MGLAVDTVGFHKTDPGTTPVAATVSAGDSFTIRSFPSTAQAWLQAFFRQTKTGTAGSIQVKSPRLANSSTGIRVAELESPSGNFLGAWSKQQMYSTDTLTVLISGKTTASSTVFGAFQVYYTTLNGVSARLHSAGEILNNVTNIFTQYVAVHVATAGTWVTVLSKNTADLMKADTTYALLGYSVLADYGVVGIKALETGNLRICGPGFTKTTVTTSWFVDRSNELGMPYIPVVNSNNRGNVNVTANAGKTVNSHISLIWAQLTNPVTP